MFYLSLAVILLLFALLYTIYDKPIGKAGKIILFLCFWLIAALAWETGVDWYVYKNTFQQSNSIDMFFLTGELFKDGTSTEPGYALLSSSLRFFSNEYQLLPFTLLFFASVFFFKALSRYSKNYFLILLMYLGYVYLTLNMSGIRQALSLSIIFYSIRFIEEKNFWRYIVTILFASCFHYSALVMIPLYFLLNRVITTKVYAVIIGVGLVFYITRIGLISEAVQKISEISNDPILYKLYLYAITASDELPSMSPKIFLNVMLFILVLMRRGILVARFSYINIFINIFALYIILGEFLWDTGDIVIRFQHYFVLGLIVSLASYVESLEITGNKVIFCCALFIVSIWSSNPIFFEKPNAAPYNPYQNYILYQLSGTKSTGEDRLNTWKDGAAK